MQVYLTGKEFDEGLARKLAARTMRRMGNVAFVPTTRFSSRTVSYTGRYKQMRVDVMSHGFRVVGTDRGGIRVHREPHQRLSPCTLPTNAVYIDYNCQVMPCCNVRSDNPDEADCACGELTADNCIFDIYAGERFVAWRESLYGFGPKQGPCATCSFGEEPNNALNRWLSRVTCPDGHEPVPLQVRRPG